MTRMMVTGMIVMVTDNNDGHENYKGDGSGGSDKSS